MRKIYLVILLGLLLGPMMGWGQQVIGTFPNFDGGFEGQTSVTVASSIATGVQQTGWTITTASNTTSTIGSSTARSGSKFLTFGYTATSSVRMQSPTAPTTILANATAYTVQFFYRTISTTAPTNVTIGNSPDGTLVPGTYASPTLAATNGVWSSKFQVSQTSGSSTASPRYGVGILRYSNVSTVNVDYDDYVVYAGTADNTAPNSPGTVTVIQNATNPTTKLDVSWGAASLGVDGGGYVVLRYATNPNADNDPNQNGIYAVGNTTTNGAGSLTGTIVYIGTALTFTDDKAGAGLTPGTTYYYKVYTVDKAFNYSAEILGNGTTASALPTNPTSFSISCASHSKMNVTLNSPTVGTVLVFANTTNSFTAPTGAGSGFTGANNDYVAAANYAAVGGKLVYSGAGANFSMTNIGAAAAGTPYYLKAYSYTGSVWSAGTATINSNATTQPVSAVTATPVPGQITLNWANPGSTACFTNVIVIAREGAAVETAISKATLDGLVSDADFTGATQVWTSNSNTNDVYDLTLTLVGTDNTNYHVYKGTGTSTVLTGLTQGNTYYYTIFTVDGTGSTARWSSRVDVSATVPSSSITLAPITQAKGPFCNGTSNSISVDYTISGTVTTPFIQLSNASGSFASSTTNLISTISGSGPYTITGTIPAAQSTGTLYRVRIVSTDGTPVISADNGSDIIINAVPATPGAITVPAAIPCASTVGNVYSISAVSGATSYTWSVTGTGWSVVNSGIISQSVTVGTGIGTVSVTATNTCGTSLAQTTANITPNTAPVTPTFSATTATNNVVAPLIGATTLTYSIAAVAGATGYTWSVASLTGWSITAGAGTTSITVTVGTGSGNVTVTANNACGSSSPVAVFAVTPLLGTFYSQTTGNPATLSNWNTVRGGGGAVPGSLTGGNFVIQNGHTMTTTGTLTIGQTGSFLQIENGGILTADFAVTIATGASFKIDDGGKYIHNNTGTLSTTIFAGTESFGANSTVEIQKWQATTSMVPASLTASILVGANNYKYGNLIFNYTTLGTSLFAGALSGTVYLCAGSLTVNSTGTYTTGTYASSGVLEFATAASGPDVYVLGNYTQAANTYVDFNSNTAQTKKTTLFLYGNYSVASAVLDNTGSSFAQLNFYKSSGIQTINVASAADHYFVNLFAGDGSSTNTVQLSANLSGALAQLSNLTVASNAIFDMNGFNMNMRGDLAGVITVNGTLLGNTGTVLANATGQSVVVNGIFKTANTNGFSGAASTAVSSTNSPAITLNSASTVEYNGVASQVLTGSVNYANLLLNNPTGYTMAQNATVTANLALTQGIVVTGSNKVISTSGTINSAASTGLALTGLTSYINGNLQMPFASGTLIQTFPIGDVTNYTPLTLNFASISTAGAVTASTTNTAQANFGISQFDQTKYVKRTWTITNNGTAFTTFSPTFNFVAGDIQGGANTSNFIGGVYGSSWAYPTVGTKTTTNTQLTGSSVFGDYMVGEISPNIINTGAVSTTLCAGATVSVPYTGTGIYSGTYTVQLSNSTGSFAAPTTIGTGTGTSPIIATIPTGTATGAGYRIRVVNSTPLTYGTDNGSNITINTSPVISTQPTSLITACDTYTGSLSVAVSAGSNLTYTWNYSATGSGGWTPVTNGTPNLGVTYSTSLGGAQLNISGLTQTYYYQCVISNGGCTSVISNTSTINVNVTPAAPVGTAGTVIGSNSFTANWGAVVGATGYYVDVYTYVPNVTAAAWTFPLSGATITTDVFSANNSGKTIISTGGSIVDADGATTRAPSASSWASGSSSKSWEIIINTIGFSNLKVSSKQRSSGTGPRDFKIQYKLGAAGVWTDVAGGAVPAIANDFISGVVNNLVLPSSCNEQTNLYIRWIMTTNTDVNGNTVANGGTSRIDDVYIAGDLFTYVSGYQNVYTTDTYLDVSGLSASTNYYSVVRATNGTCTSASSIPIMTTTAVPCTSVASIAGFTPGTGPSGTVVTITGFGFTAVTNVKFGSLNATTFTIVNDNTITARTPANTATDKITLVVGTCNAVSAGSFVPLFQSGTCGSSSSGAVTDLFISEVYDALVGSLSYVEIFNGTAGFINLSNYKVRFITGTNNINDYALSNVNLASGATYVASVGSSSGGTCSNFTAGINYPTGNGFNGNDRVYLLNGVTPIDYVPNPDYGKTPVDAGFSQTRNASTTRPRPSTTYYSDDWTNSSVEDCSNLGVSPYSLNATTITLNSHPADVSCNQTITFSVEVAATGLGTLSYEWRYNAPGVSTWSLVSALPSVTVTGSGTNSITITGPTSNLKNYQFYCDVSFGSPGCTVTTNTAQYTYDSRIAYRSKASGNWSDKNTWEMSNDLSTWVNACPSTPNWSATSNTTLATSTVSCTSATSGSAGSATD